MPQFSTDESVSLERQIKLTSNLVETDENKLEEIYEIAKCCDWIRSNNFQKVCLQFPDHLLSDSTVVAMKLQNLLQQTVYVLGDTAYESCCIDYVAAAHINADCIIHFGPTCFSNALKEIPFLYIFEKSPLNIEDLKDSYKKLFQIEDDIILLLDSEYIHYFDKICDIFANFINIEVQKITSVLLELDDKNILYVGNNLRKLMNVHLNYKVNKSYYFNPKKQPPQIINYQLDPRILKKRYFLMEKIRDAQTIGIVVGTLGVKNYLEVINRTKKLIEVSNKKYYLISVGKPTVAKLANFPEIDVFVIISCSMNEIFESRDYYKPIVTALDVEMALNENSANLHFSYDYNNYLSKLDDVNISAIETDVSLVTGKIRSSVQEHSENDLNDQHQIALKTEGTLAINTSFGAGFLSNRSWKGLEQNLGQTEVSKVQEGQKGIAQGYENEPF